jgi:hypothetical protein
MFYLHAHARHSPFQEDAQQWQAVDQGPAPREPQAQLDSAEALHHSQLQSSRQQTEQARQCAHHAQQQAQNTVAEVDAASRAAATTAAGAEARLEAQVQAPAAFKLSNSVPFVPLHVMLRSDVICRGAQHRPYAQ